MNEVFANIFNSLNRNDVAAYRNSKAIVKLIRTDNRLGLCMFLLGIGGIITTKNIKKHDAEIELLQQEIEELKKKGE